MTTMPTPGCIAYTAYCTRLYQHSAFAYEQTWLAWGLLSETERASWEAAAEAVLADVRGHAHAVVAHWHAWHRDATAPALPLHTAMQVLEAWLAMHEEARHDAP